MIEKGIMTTAAIDRLAEIYENEVGPQLGAAVVAKAWTDPEFKARLLANATEACAETGHRRPAGRGHGRGGEHRHRAQRDHLHAVLLLPVAGAGAAAELVQGPAVPRPIVREPRKVLREDFGFDVPDSVEVRVWDSSSEMRYWVLPRAPRAPRASTRRRWPRSSPATR